jgi:hypothetical protein
VKQVTSHENKSKPKIKIGKSIAMNILLFISIHSFIHLIREIGQIAYALGTKNQPVFAAKLTEASVLLKFLAYRYKMSILSQISKQCTYSKKLAHVNRKDM